MKNKILVSILLFGLLTCSLTACKKEEEPKAEDVVAEEVEFLSTKAQGGSDEYQAEENTAGSKSTGKSDIVNKFEPIDDDNLPF